MKKSWCSIGTVLLGVFCVGGQLPSCWCDKILQLCNEFDDSKSALPTVNSAYYLQFVQDPSCEPIAFLSPPVILWSPLEQLRDLLQVPVFCPKCVIAGQDSVPLYSAGWHTGTQGERSEPRKIYGADGITLLVGRIYKCTSRGHEVIGYHPFILQCIPQCFIPFQLWHRTGFTTDFIKLVAILVSAGMNLSGIRGFYQRKLLSMFYCRKTQFSQVTGESSLFPSPDVWKGFFPNFAPSIHALSGCFLTEFWTNNSAYTLAPHAMMKVSHG